MVKGRAVSVARPSSSPTDAPQSFKLRLRPRTMRLNMNGMRFSPLPKKKTAVHVFGDFLAYLHHCTKKFIIDTHANGEALWSAVENNSQFVLSHPNGWEGPQQSKMRRAAICGGLIPDTNAGKARIWFVTEGEASLHACVLNGLAADVLSVSIGEGLSRVYIHILARAPRSMVSSLLMQVEERWTFPRMPSKPHPH